jgi:uridine kinase
MNDLLNSILSKVKEMPTERSLLVGISGIDAGGKGFITAKLADEIRRKGFRVANINVDGWLNLPLIRFNPENPAENFYRNAIRFDEMFEKLILPLRTNRSINLIADFSEETANDYRKHQYIYKNIDIILLEGIFLFKNEFKKYFDVKIWIECSFETALRRAVARAQENLSPEETAKAYETIYFPAQKIHFAKDKPHESADLVFYNG